MVNNVKKWLYKALGPLGYFRIINYMFFLTYRSGLLRPFRNFKCHYYVPSLIRPGDYVIDIGANMGYYTVLFAENTGKNGKVFSVEPVPLYRKILCRNTESFDHVKILPYALGMCSKTVQMGIPGSPHRHGLTQILSEEATQDVVKTFEARMRPPQDIFDGLSRLDYVKCDIEGFESEVLPAMKELLREYRPILQVEIASENRKQIHQMMEEMDYRAFFVEEGNLVPVRDSWEEVNGDWIFQPS